MSQNTYVNFIVKRKFIMMLGTLMSTLVTMKFDGSRTMYEHVIKMTNIATRLKTLKMIVNENFLVQFILNLLPS